MSKKNEIAKVILKGMLVSGGVAVASTNPYFVSRALPKIISAAKYELKRKNKIKNFKRSFYYLKSRDMVEIEDRCGQIYISLTKEGKKRAGKFQINDLEIPKPKKWDKKWRVLIFDIREKHKLKREALRGKLKELGLYKLQDSVWTCPYSFQKEVKILRNFFQLTQDEMKIITASNIEDDERIKSFFGLD